MRLFKIIRNFVYISAVIDDLCVGLLNNYSNNTKTFFILSKTKRKYQQLDTGNTTRRNNYMRVCVCVWLKTASGSGNSFINKVKQKKRERLGRSRKWIRKNELIEFEKVKGMKEEIGQHIDDATMIRADSGRRIY